MKTVSSLLAPLAILLTTTIAHGQEADPPPFEVGSLEGGGTIPYGSPAPDYSFPGVARISFGGNNPGCTGTLISDQVIITARHCIYVAGTTQLKNRLSVTFRSTETCQASGPHYVRISNRTTYHHVKTTNSDEGDRARDVALIKLPSPVNCARQRITPISQDSVTGSYRVIPGWGLTLLTTSAAADKLYFVPPNRIKLTGSTNYTLNITDNLMLNGRPVTNPVCNADSGTGVFRMSSVANINKLELIGVIQHYTVSAGNPRPPGPDRPATERVDHCIKYGEYAVAARSDVLVSFIKAGLRHLQ